MTIPTMDSMIKEWLDETARAHLILAIFNFPVFVLYGCIVNHSNLVMLLSALIYCYSNIVFLMSPMRKGLLP
jgi:hypothetical protein